MAKSSIHDKLERVRKPRVHIKYNVEIGDALEEREIPFVVGVLGDFSGDPTSLCRRCGTGSSSRSTATISTTSWPA